MRHLHLLPLLLTTSSLAADPPAADPYPPVEQVAEAIHRAAAFYRSNLSFAGGYAVRWKRDLSQVFTSDVSGTSVISIESPGTPHIGMAYVRAYRVTGDALYLQGAREVAQVLRWTQLSSGGWETYHDFSLPWARKQHYRRDLLAGDAEPGNRFSRTSLDDGKTQGALLFLLEFMSLPECQEDGPTREALQFALDALLAAQAPNGGFPQQFSGPADAKAAVIAPTLPKDWPHTWPAVDYTSFYTINDGNLRSLGRVLQRAHQLTGEARYLEALKRLGDFLILAQCPDPQPGWAQQYNAEMQPVWARKFEPPAISSAETLSALETLNDIWLVTGEEKYRAPFAKALEWLEGRRLPDGQYARFYELHTNQPLYFVKDSYELTYDDSNMPTHYGFKLDDLQEDIDKFKERQQLSREEQLKKLQDPATPREWLSKAKGAAKKTVTALKNQNKEGVWTDDNEYDARAFLKHVNAMIQYLEAAQKSGDLFDRFKAGEKL
ncbi:MAG: hypothetical protein KDK99_07070 [Verrucomicrobiales bacterium]|nr:hypothetical protein [Verrucomicrobiales bacterium]